MNVGIIKATWAAFTEDKASRLASSIAYATLFSIAPLFIVLIAIVGWVLGIANGGHGHRAAEDHLIDQVRHGAGSGAADAVRQLVAASFNKPRQSIIAQVLGWVTFVIGASGLFGALQDALNTIWHIEATKAGWKGMLRDRFTSIGILAAVGFLLIVSFVLNAGVLAVGTHFSSLIPYAGGAAVVTVLAWVMSLGIVTLVLGMIYKVLPDVKLAWRDVWLGAFGSAVLFVVGQVAISFYLVVAGVASAYGAAGSILVILVWIYYSAMILLIGAEFTKVCAESAATTIAASIRQTTDRPAGVDPRKPPAH
jgi:membrane protein